MTLQIAINVLLIPGEVDGPQLTSGVYPEQECMGLYGKFPAAYYLPDGIVPQLGIELGVLPVQAHGGDGFVHRRVYDMSVCRDLVVIYTDWHGGSDDIDRFLDAGYKVFRGGNVDDIIQRLQAAPVKPDWAA